MNDPEISVIVPIYNEEKYLEICLNSIVNQTFEEIEIICVNDGSTDKSLAIIEEYANSDDRFRIINQENHGLGYSRTVGMGEAKGKYIGFVDADDYIDKDFYLKLYKQAETYNADLVRGLYMIDNGQYCKEEGTNKIIREKYKRTESLNVNDHSVVCWNALYRKSYLDDNKISYFDNVIFEDIPFTGRATYYSKMSVPSLGIYVKTNLNDKKHRLSEFSEDKIEDLVKSNILLIDFLNRVNFNKNDYLVAYNRCIYRLLRFFDKTKIYKKFIIEKIKYIISISKFKTDLVNDKKLMNVIPSFKIS